MKRNVSEFKEFLKGEVEKICEQERWSSENYKHRSRAFNLWLAQFFKENNRYIDTDPEDSLLGETDDLKIDIHLEDETNKIIWLIQGEFTGTTSKSSTSAINEAKVESFFSNHENLSDIKWVKKYGNKIAVEKLRNYKKDIEDDDYKFKYIFISTGKASDRVFAVADRYNRRYEKKNISIECALYDFSALKEYYNKAQSIEASIPDRVEFDMPSNKMFIKDAPQKTVVASIKANSIENIYKQYQESLFASNIRTYLGEKGINKEMVSTAESEPENFFYFNNGISAVCTKLEIKKTGNKSNKYRLIADKFQIINGAQTVGALRAIKDNPKLEILMRVTETKSISPDKGINEKIIRYNNTQNKITLSDFRSNDPLQLNLLKKFKEKQNSILGKINYIRKRGDRYQRGGIFNLKLEDLAKIRFAYLHEPCTVIGKAKSLWKIGEDGRYNQAFGVRGHIEDVISDRVFLDTFVLPVILHENILQKCRIARKEKEELRFLKRFRFHFLYFFKKILDELEKNKKIPVSVKKLVHEEAYLNKFTDSIFEKIRDKVSDLYYDETEKDEYKNAPIRDLTINTKHLDKLEKKIMAKLPNIDLG